MSKSPIRHIHPFLLGEVPVKKYMKFKVAKEVLGKIANMLSSMMFRQVRGHAEQDDIHWLCGMCDLYRELKKKAEKYSGQEGNITINVTDTIAEGLRNMIGEFVFDEMRNDETNDIEWACTMSDIYRSLSCSDKPDLDDVSQEEDAKQTKDTVKDDDTEDVVAIEEDHKKKTDAANSDKKTEKSTLDDCTNSSTEEILPESFPDKPEPDEAAQIADELLESDLPWETEGTIEEPAEDEESLTDSLMNDTPDMDDILASELPWD